MKQAEVSALVVVLFLLGAALAQASRVRIAIQADEQPRTQKSLAGVASVQAVMTTAGLTALQRSVTPSLINNLIASINLPPIQGAEGIDILGLTVQLNYTVANVSITNVTFSQDSLAIVPGSGLSFSVADGGAHITADFAYSIPNPLVNLNGHGKANVVVSKLGVQLQVNAVADEKGYPVVSCPKASVVLGQLSTTITSDSTLLDVISRFFVWLFNGTIRDQIQTAVTSAIYTNLNQTANELIRNQSLVIGLPLNGSRALIDVSLPSSPMFTPNYLLVPLKGEVFLAPNQHSNYTAKPLPALATNQMLQLSISSFVFDTAGWTYYESGVLTYLINNEDLPPWLPFKLNTATFSFLLPALYQRYPNWEMNIDFAVARPISFRIDPTSAAEGISVALVGDLEVNVIAPNGSWIPVFVLETTFSLKFDLYFAQNSSDAVHGKLYISNFTTIIKSSQIGTFDVSVINFILDALYDNVLLAPLNDFLQVTPIFTFPPVAGFHYVNPALVYNANYMTLSADFAVSPPATVRPFDGSRGSGSVDTPIAVIDA